MRAAPREALSEQQISAGLAAGQAGKAAAAVAAAAKQQAAHGGASMPPPEVACLAKPWPQPWQLRGTGQLRFFKLQVYEAQLWTGPHFDADNYWQHPLALAITYQRRLAGDAIAERSLAEMRRIGSFNSAQERRWLALMTKAFPDVQAHERLSGVADGQGSVQFFHNGKLSSEAFDADFCRLFFGIWLAAQTSAPALRQALLGTGAG